MLNIKKLKWSLLPIIKTVFYLFGKSWNDFYAWMLDYQDRRVTISDILRKSNSTKKYKGLWDWEQGKFFYDFIKEHGYRDDQIIFDIGCGYGRLAIPVLKNQLSGGAYVGSELSVRRLQLAKDWIELEGLCDKNFELILSKGLSLDFLDENSIDCFTAFSVFNHMPDVEFEALANEINKKMKIGAIGFCHMVVDENYVYRGVEAFPRSLNDIISLFNRSKFSVSVIDDYKISKLQNSSYVRMFKITKTDGSIA